ncbi:cupin domain-containing protein [Bacillus spizizenii]|nr:cupin domain-containing protein [Bacillus spizizenii]
MKVLLLSGGSGKRLWPLSNPVRSKQFLKLLKTEHGASESMIQRVCRQLHSVGLLESTFIVTSKSQTEVIKQQIDDRIPVIFEPSQRGTFPSISLAITYLHSVLKVSPTEIICILPVDSFADLTFYQLLKNIPSILSSSKDNIALLGVKPEFPTDQYGYIVPNTFNKNGYYPVGEFLEKPSLSIAKNLIKQEAFWNCGVFAFPLKYMLDNLTTLAIPNTYEEILRSYDQLPNISFDYQVVEKEKKSIVIPYNGMWRDLGTWDRFTEQLENRIIGLGSIENSTNTNLINELSIPIHIIGVSNSIIVASPDGILVSNKKKSSKIKDIVNSNLIMYEEKRWGNCRILDSSISEEGKKSVTKILNVTADKNISYQKHDYREKTWVVLSGKGEIILNDEFLRINEGDVFKIPAKTKHGIKAYTPLKILETQIGYKIEEDDIIYFTDFWEEISKESK